jgi:hypothetical protein
MIQDQIPTPEMVLGPLLAWGKLVLVAATFIAAALIMRARFNDFVAIVRGLTSAVAGLREELRNGLDEIKDVLADHRAELAVLKDRSIRAARASDTTGGA